VRQARGSRLLGGSGSGRLRAQLEAHEPVVHARPLGLEEAQDLAGCDGLHQDGDHLRGPAPRHALDEHLDLLLCVRKAGGNPGASPVGHRRPHGRRDVLVPQVDDALIVVEPPPEVLPVSHG
jgi:hypothetical protein